MLMRISERVLESNSSVLLFTICSMFTASLSSGWSLQMAPGSCALFRSDIAFLLEKTAGKDILDPMNFHSDIGRRKPSNFRDGGRVHVLQMRNHDLPVQRFELADEPRELLQRSLAIDVRLAILARRGPSRLIVGVASLVGRVRLDFSETTNPAFFRRSRSTYETAVL